MKVWTKTVGIGAVGLLGALAPQDSWAIITRHDVDDADYVVDDADFPALVDLFEPGDCIGTLIHPSYLLTVAHCAEDLSTRDTLSVNGVAHDVGEVILHPDYRGWTDDIALVKFVEPVAGVTPLVIYRETDELGQTLTLVGRGVHATGLEGERGGSTDGQLRRAHNMVSDVDAHWIEVSFEAPDEAGVLDLEGVGAAGDSGGPAFVETAEGVFIAGLNSWGDAPSGVRIGQYGAWDYSTRVSSYADWIDGEVGVEEEEPDDPGDDGDAGGGGDEDHGGDGSGDEGGDHGGDDHDDHDHGDHGHGDDGEGKGGCASAPGPAGLWVWLLGLGVLRRRRPVA